MLLDIINKMNKSKFVTEKQAAQIQRIYEEEIENPFLEMLNSVDAIESDNSDSADSSGSEETGSKSVPPPLFGDVGSIFIE